MTDYEIAGLLVSLYGGSDGFDHYDPGSSSGGICWALKRTSDLDVLCLRGSTTFEDWIRDLIALAAPFSHQAFGPVHPGFELGMERAAAQIRTFLDSKKPVIVAGHSLGAGRSAIMTALLLEAGYTIARRVAFGEPKPGFQQLADYIKSVPAASYRNAGVGSHDLITNVPFSFPPEEYVHAAPLIDVHAEPSPFDKWGPFRYHHMELYCQAVKGKA